ncbi:MAG: Holliday junction branch migration protein RuvA [Opitutales bacterium]|nr:Holliday junction branch migration protein RuvA [Opitutales bacterium]
MIVSLRGKLIESALFQCVIECAGVGYGVNIPITTSEKLPKLGEEVRLFVCQIFREDDQSLYGFADRETREFFKLIVEKVSGIGPGTALKLLSRFDLPQLKTAIAVGDLATISKTPGIGKKTAERLIVELKDKMDVPASAGVSLLGKNGVPETSSSSSAQADAIAALVALGFAANVADKAVRAAAAKAGSEATAEILIRAALSQ